ncbi:MAG: molybdate ABC transporter permease subunit [Caulobacteraceae bacterium]|nr:molybdate ABC transporter permease subunit [Caulobacteraceae bacterium]
MSLLTADDFGAVLLSLRVALTATLFGLPPAFLCALALARGRFAGRQLLDALVTLPLVLPPVATGYGLLMLLGAAAPGGRLLASLGLVLSFRWTGAAVAAGIMAFPLMVRPMRLSIEAIDREVEESAITLGAGRLVRLARIILPLAMPGVVAGAVLGFAKALGEFGATITFVGAIPGETLTLPSAIYAATQSPGEGARTLALCGVAAALAVASVLVSAPLARAAARWAGRGD